MEDNNLQQNNDVETLKEKSKWGGARPNAGRPEGSMNKATKEKRLVEEEFKQRVLNSANNLISSQMTLAHGVQMLFKIETKRWQDKNGKWKEETKKPKLVTNQTEIENYLSGEIENKDDYYFITTERPDNRALDSLFDRVFGKSVSNVDITSKGERVEAFNFISNNDSGHKTNNKTGGSLEETTG